MNKDMETKKGALIFVPGGVEYEGEIFTKPPTSSFAAYQSEGESIWLMPVKTVLIIFLYLVLWLFLPDRD